MGKVETTGILTEQQFSKSPLRNFMSYQDYFSKALKLGSAFTFQRAFALQKSEDLSENITNSVKGWYLEKENQKDQAEVEYYAALEQYGVMKNAQDKALKQLNYTTNIYGENSSRYNEALKKYNLSSNTLFNADVNLSCARDRFNSANLSAHKAFFIAGNLPS